MRHHLAATRQHQVPAHHARFLPGQQSDPRLNQNVLCKRHEFVTGNKVFGRAFVYSAGPNPDQRVVGEVSMARLEIDRIQANNLRMIQPGNRESGNSNWHSEARRVRLL